MRLVLEASFHQLALFLSCGVIVTRNARRNTRRSGGVTDATAGRKEIMGEEGASTTLRAQQRKRSGCLVVCGGGFTTPAGCTVSDAHLRHARESGVVKQSHAGRLVPLVCCVTSQARQSAEINYVYTFWDDYEGIATAAVHCCIPWGKSKTSFEVKQATLLSRLVRSSLHVPRFERTLEQTHRTIQLQW